MAGNGVPPRDSTRFVAMFQKAHSHLASLQRVDEQIAVLLEQRRKTIDDLRAVQAMINSEFARVMEQGRPISPEALLREEELLTEGAKVAMELKENPPRRDARPSGNPVNAAPRIPTLQTANA